MQGKTHYDYKRKKTVPIKPKQEFLATAVRQFCSDLVDVNMMIIILAKLYSLQKDVMSSFDFSFVIFQCKKCLLGQTKRRGTLLTMFRPPRNNSAAPPPPRLIYFTQTTSNLPLIRLPSPCLFRTLE